MSPDSSTTSRPRSLEQCNGNAGVGDGGGGVSAEHVGGTRGSGIVSSTADVLGMSVVRGMCEMCMCLARSSVGGEGGEWMR